MAGFFKSSIGQKLFMSITGLFLIIFLLVHLTVNSFLVFDCTGELFNKGAHFMVTNPIIRIVEPVLFLGFILHIIYASILTLQNQSARPVGYKKVDAGKSSKWVSRNMYVLGGFVFIFLAIHIANFYYKMRFGCMEDMMVEYDGVEMENAFLLVSALLSQWWYSILYVAGAIFLGLHLHHAFWSAFQTIGLSNDKWRKRLEVIGDIYAVIIALGFAFIAIFFLIKTCI
jgi:succinate dehydrogenase cytochrome b subunit